MRAPGVDVRPSPVKSPNGNAFIEHWGESLRRDRLERGLALGETHLNHLVRKFVPYYHEIRAQQGVGDQPLPAAGSRDPPVLPFPAGVLCRTRPGGLVRHYAQAA